MEIRQAVSMRVRAPTAGDFESSHICKCIRADRQAGRSDKSKSCDLVKIFAVGKHFPAVAGRLGRP